VASQRFAHLQRTGNWRVGHGRKNQRHSIASRQARQFTSDLGSTERIRFSNNLVERMRIIALLINQQLGVTDDVDKKDMRDFELNLFLNLNGHLGGEAR
jgi:hypothetical protein